MNVRGEIRCRSNMTKIISVFNTIGVIPWNSPSDLNPHNILNKKHIGRVTLEHRFEWVQESAHLIERRSPLHNTGAAPRRQALPMMLQLWTLTVWALPWLNSKCGLVDRTAVAQRCSQGRVHAVPFRPEGGSCRNPLLDREPVPAHENRSNVFIDPSVADHPCSHILDQLQFADCVPGKSHEKTIIQIQLWGHKGMDQLLARVQGCQATSWSCQSSYCDIGLTDAQHWHEGPSWCWCQRWLRSLSPLLMGQSWRDLLSHSPWRSSSAGNWRWSAAPLSYHCWTWGSFHPSRCRCDYNRAPAYLHLCLEWLHKCEESRVISKEMILQAVIPQYSTKQHGVDSEELRPQNWALQYTIAQLAGFRPLTTAGHHLTSICKVGCKPVQTSASYAQLLLQPVQQNPWYTVSNALDRSRRRRTPTFPSSMERRMSFWTWSRAISQLCWAL